MAYSAAVLIIFTLLTRNQQIIYFEWDLRLTLLLLVLCVCKIIEKLHSKNFMHRRDGALFLDIHNNMKTRNFSGNIPGRNKSLKTKKTSLAWLGVANKQ